MRISPEDVDSDSYWIHHVTRKFGTTKKSKTKTYLFNGALDNRMNDEMCLRDFDILLQMKKRQFEFGNFFLRHRNS